MENFPIIEPSPDLLRNTYYYDSEGLRSRKNIYIKNANGGYTYNGKVMYQYLGGLLTYQCTYNAADEVDTELYFFYDSYSRLTAIRYISSIGDYYYYVTTNKQGDVLGLYSANGNLKVSYEYDAWGNCTVKDSAGNAITSSIHIGNVNPIRYRSYYYDSDTGLYYLQSRYYDATIGRFINADGEISGIGGNVLGNNTFAYCMNNPVNYSDPTGHWPKILKEIGSRIVHTAKMFIKTCISPLKAINAEVGAGIGVGAKVKTSIEGVPIEAGAVASIKDSITYDKFKLDVRNTSSVEAGVNIAGWLDFMYEYEKSHSYFDENCNCSFMESTFGEKNECAANQPISGTASGIGFSVGAYLGIGAEASICIDFAEWNDELMAIYDESMAYKGYY